MGVNVEETISGISNSHYGLPSLHFCLPANANAVSYMPPAAHVILIYSYDMTRPCRQWIICNRRQRVGEAKPKKCQNNPEMKNIWFVSHWVESALAF